MKRPRITIALVMILVAASAGVFSIAQRWMRTAIRPPRTAIGDVQYYNNAIPSDDLKIRIGPNTFAIDSVSRNDRDGSIRVEDGRGWWKIPRSTPETAAMKSSAPWLDVATIRLAGDPDRIEVVELRVFDYATRTLIGKDMDHNHGSRLVSPGVYQIYQVGALLPAEVDVCLRASSHPPGEKISRLAPKVGATAPYETGTLTVAELRGGHPDWTEVEASPDPLHPAIAWGEDPRPRTHKSTFVIDWAGSPGVSPAQVVAVAREGRRAYWQRPGSFDFLDSHRMVIPIDFDLDEIDHLEIRPYRLARSFYFEGVRLPKASTRPFADPPAVTVKLDGRPTKQRLAAFDPILVDLEVRQDGGGYMKGADDHGQYFPPPDESRGHPGFHVLADTIGLMPDGWRLSLFDRGGEALLGPYDAKNGSGHASASRYRASWGIEVPLERLGSAEIRFSTPAQVHP
ncbi:hypothetical protein TA3x_004472 [Tundrisphaera sp. TA3]|uniref:hypothetical protein n=1 Tax=Tundrisphaera sp. TA3 TaxID=3435775 RepID=UPI003EBDA1DA